jgi:hypothetical protein
MPRLSDAAASFLEALSAAWYGLWNGLSNIFNPERRTTRGPGSKSDGKREDD